MRIAAILVAGFVTLGLTAEAVAQTTPGTDPTATAKPKKAPRPKQICKSVNKTGSRMPESVCHTQAEWDAIAQQGPNSTDLSGAPLAGAH